MNETDFVKELKTGNFTILNQVYGGNSSVFKASNEDNETFAIKKYRGEESRIQRMLARENSAITFLKLNNVENIPEVVDLRSDLGVIVYRWIDGESPDSNFDSMSAIIDMCKLLSNLNVKSSIVEPAIDAAFSLADIKTQIQARISAMESTYSNPIIWEICNHLRERLSVCPSKSLVFMPDTLSISDLGVHNILAHKTSYTFIDFEFFGIDSVVKMVGDFLLHPRNEFDSKQMLRFIDSISDCSSWDHRELISVIPLLTLKWSVIAFGRLFRESSGSTNAVFSREVIYGSVGFNYLRYFDEYRQRHFDGSFQTFRSFADTLAIS